MLPALTALLLAAAPATASAPLQGELELHVGKEEYLLPAVGEAAERGQEEPPMAPEMRAVLEAWRPFAWDAEEEEYRYSFAIAPESGAVLVMLPGGGAQSIARECDKANKLLAEYVGEGAMKKDHVVLLTRDQKELLRAAEHASGLLLGDASRADDHLAAGSHWMSAAASNPVIYLPPLGFTACLDGHSEKWSPEHELVRGHAQVVLTRNARYLAHMRPLLIGLTWNIEMDVLGDLISVPYLEGFQVEVGRGKWSTGQMKKILKNVEERVKEEQDRPATLADFGYLGRGDGLPEESAALAYGVARHLVRHHGEALPGLMNSLSERVVAEHTTTSANGATSFQVPATYVMPWEDLREAMSEHVGDFDLAELRACMTARCDGCRAYGKARDIR